MNPINKNKNNPNSSTFKHILKALGGATVSTLSLLSLCLNSAQAASFVTTFSTDSGDVTFEWSGSDGDGDRTIDFSELSGPGTVGIGGERYDLGNPKEWDYGNFSYNLSEGLLDLSSPQTFSVGRIGDWGMYFDGSDILMLSFIQDFGIRGKLISQETVGTVGGGDADLKATPEPTLTLGFITLGGLMLGSKRKSKG